MIRTKCNLPYAGCYQCNPEQWERVGERVVQKREPVKVKPNIKIWSSYLTVVLDQLLREHAELAVAHVKLSQELKLSEQMVLDMYPLGLEETYQSGSLRAKKVASYRPAKNREEYQYVKIWQEPE